MTLLLTKRIKITFLVSLFSLVMIPVFGQTGTLTGKVADTDGTPIIGANVVIEGTTTGTVTDIDGNFTLSVPAGTNAIAISFIGYLSETLDVNVAENSTQNIEVTLVEDLMELDDVVVIGYGVQKKSDLTGAVVSVSSEDITSTTNISIENALQGRAAGVRITSQTGAPGGETNVYIRGVTSINESGAMWVVDGVPADPNTINPNDIASLEILKDAATTAIYGAAGGNGVVMVTTKKGKSGKTTATLNITHGVQTVPKSRYLDMASGPEYGQMYTEYQRLRRAREDDIVFPDYENLPNYDYQDEIFRNAPMSDYHLGISGGNEHSTFSIGLGYTKQEGVLRNSNYSKITARINSDHQLNNWIKVGEQVSLSRQLWGGFEEWELLNEYHSPILMALQYQPFVPVYVDSLGNEASEKNDFTNWSASPIGNVTNPVSRIETTNKERESFGIKATVYAELEPIKGLTITSRLSGDLSGNNAYSFTPIYDVSGSNRSLTTSIYRNSGDYHGWQWQNFISYSRSFFDAHNFTIMAGMEAGEEWSKYMFATRENLISEEPEMWYFNASLNDTLDSQIAQGSGWERSGYGYFGRISYDYKGIVLGQFNIRKDYDSRFGQGQRSGVFPSYSVGLKFTEFDAVKSALPFMNFGKIRWSSGEIGNNPLDDYTYYSKVSTQQVFDYSFDNSGTNSIGAAKSQLNNPYIHWEAVKTKNLGLDLGFMQNKLSVTTEWFHRANDGMIMNPDVPGHAGWIVRDRYQEIGSSEYDAEPDQNIGKMVNKGFEFQIGWKESHGKFSYSVDFNYTYVSTVAKDLPDTIFDGQITGVNDYLAWTVPNGALSEYYGLQVERLFRPEDYDEELEVITNQPYVEDPETGERVYAQPNAEPGDFKFKDINGDNVIDDKDKGPIGNPIPKHDFGLNINLEYGWFDFNLFIQGATGFKIFNAQKIYQFSTDGAFNWSSEYVNDHYRPDIYDREGNLVFEANYNGKYPRIDLANSNGNFTNVSDFYMEDGSYVRVKNVQLGMTLPTNWTQVAGIQSFRIFCGVQNLFTFTSYSGFDPEIGSERLTLQGLDKGAYPKPRMYTIGLNVKF